MSSAQLKLFDLVKPAEIEWRDGLPFSLEFNDVYFSIHGAIEESTHVFIEGNQLLSNWKDKPNDDFVIAELGFGCGLNFLNTFSHWIKHQKQVSVNSNSAKQHLHFISIEMRPFSFDNLKQALKRFPQLKLESELLLTNYPSTSYGRHRIEFKEHNLSLTLFWMPIEKALNDLVSESLAQEDKTAVDYWYLDGFAPSKNEAMWCTEVTKNLAFLSTKGSRLATYSVAGSVKKPLANAGFQLTKIKGFAKKREMLTGIFHPKESEDNTDNSTPSSKFINIKYEKPWFNISNSHSIVNVPSPNKNKVAIIGAGLAGCATAYFLGNKGFNCDIFESNKEIACGGSGAAAGIFHPQITSDMNIASQFSWQSYLYLCRFLKNLSANEKERIITCHGVNRILDSSDTRDQILQLSKDLDLSHWMKEESECDDKILSNRKGLFFPHAGVININQFCSLLLNKTSSEKLTVHLNEKVNHVKNENHHWIVKSNNRETKGCATKVRATKDLESRYDHVIFCGGAGSQIIGSIVQNSNTYLHTTKGQTCHFESEPLSEVLNHVLSEKIYLSPYKNNHFQLGASFEHVDDQTDGFQATLDPVIQNQLLKSSHKLITSLGISTLSQEEINNMPLNGTVGLRLHTKDRLPMVGAVPDHIKLINTFKNLGQKRILRDSISHYNQQGLWLNTAYGSHGLLHCLIASQHIASLICNEISPLETRIAQALHPARFFIKDLR